MMRGKKAKALRRAVYGGCEENDKESKYCQVSDGSLRTKSFRAQYQQEKGKNWFTAE